MYQLARRLKLLQQWRFFSFGDHGNYWQSPDKGSHALAINLPVYPQVLHSKQIPFFNNNVIIASLVTNLNSLTVSG